MLRKLPVVTVIPGTPGSPGSPASVNCTPLGKDPNDDVPPPEPDTTRWVYVPNDPDDPSAGEVRTKYDEHPGDGYTCSLGNYFVVDEDGVSQPVYENRCYWNYP